MPYTQEQYERAKESLKDPGLPKSSRAIRTQRIAEFESDQARGYQREPGSNPQPKPAPVAVPKVRGEDQEGIKTWDDVRAEGSELLLNSNSPTMETVRSAMDPEEIQARREAVNWAREMARDKKLATASKLKVFAAPPKYVPPDAFSKPLSSAMAVRYFEPTVGEFRDVALAHTDKRLQQHLRSQYPDVAKLDELSDEQLESSDAFKAYSDARWQRALGDAMKKRSAITRVAFENTEFGPDGEALPDAEQSLVSNFMDGSTALMAGAIQGKTMGLYDAALSLGPESVTEFRDAQRGSMERYPLTATIGGVLGAVDPRGLPAKIAGGLGKIGNPKSLTGRAAKSALVGAGTAVIDDNARAAAEIAADALDLQATIGDTLSAMKSRLPGVRPETVALGAGVGAGADILGAGAGAAERAIRRMPNLKEPLMRAEASGVTLTRGGVPKLSQEAENLAERAAQSRTTAPQLVSEELASPLATQRLKEQETAVRSAKDETAAAQAGLENARLPTHEAGQRIKSLAAGPAITKMAENEKRLINDIATRLMGYKRVSAEELDEFARQVDDLAKFETPGRTNPAIAAVSKELKTLRDDFAGMDEQTIVDAPGQQVNLRSLGEKIDRTSLQRPENATASAYNPDAPPIDVILAPGEPPALNDGRHRLLSALDAGAKTVRVRFREYDDIGKTKRLWEESVPVDSPIFATAKADTVAEPKPQPVAGIRDAEGNVKAAKGYSVLKARQAARKRFYGDDNARMGLPEEIQPETVFGEHTDRGLFSTETPDEAVRKLAPKAKLDANQERQFRGKIEAAQGLGDAKGRDLIKSLAERTGPEYVQKLEALEQLLDAKDINAALGRGMSGLNLQARGLSGTFRPEQLLRAVPTLKSLSGGLPTKSTTSVASEAAVKRLREFIPVIRAAALRAGYPARGVGAAENENPKAAPNFSDEEAAFWMKVIDKMAPMAEPGGKEKMQ